MGNEVQTFKFRTWRLPFAKEHAPGGGLWFTRQQGSCVWGSQDLSPRPALLTFVPSTSHLPFLDLGPLIYKVRGLNRCPLGRSVQKHRTSKFVDLIATESPKVTETKKKKNLQITQWPQYVPPGQLMLKYASANDRNSDWNGPLLKTNIKELVAFGCLAYL